MKIESRSNQLKITVRKKKKKEKETIQRDEKSNWNPMRKQSREKIICQRFLLSKTLI